MLWKKIEKNENRHDTNSIGAILKNSIFGKTAKAAVSIFPQGISSKPCSNKMCLCGSSELNGDNFIIGYSAGDSNELQAGEIIIYSETSDKKKPAKIILRQSGKIEINANEKAIITIDENGKMTFELDSVKITSKTADVECSGDVNIKGSTVNISGKNEVLEVV